MLSPSDKDVESPSRPEDSNLLDSHLPGSSQEDASGQRDLDSDEMNEEMMDEYP